MGLVALVLLAGFYVLVAVVVLVYAALVVVVLIAGTGALQPMVLLAMVGLGVVVVVLVRAVAQVSSSREAPTGTTLPESSPLRPMVAELAALVGTRPPETIRITADANATVHEELRMLGLLGGPRTLTIGRALLAGLTVAELRAVIAHELGHYAHGHTRLTAIAYRGSVALAHARTAVAQAAVSDQITRIYAGIPLRLLAAYAWIYDRVTLTPRRRQELAADAAAATITSPATTANALVAAHHTAHAWADFSARFPLPTRPAPQPDDPVAAFTAMLADPAYRTLLTAALPTESPATWSDSHPPLSTRLAALTTPRKHPKHTPGKPTSRLPSAPGEPTVTLPADLTEPVEDGPADTHALPDHAPAADLVPPPPPAKRTIPWRDWIAEIAATRAEEIAAPLVAALPTPTVAAVLDLIASPSRDRVATRAAVTALIGSRLVRAGAATWTAPWAAPVLISPVAPLIAAALNDPAEVDDLRAALEESGVDIDAEIVFPPPPEQPRASLFEKAPIGGVLTPVLWFVGLITVIAVLIAASREEEKPFTPRFPITTYTVPRFPLPTYQPTYPLPGYPLPSFPLPEFTLPEFTPRFTVIPLPTR